MKRGNVKHGDEFEQYLIDRWGHLGYEKNRNKKGIDLIADGMPSIEAKSDWTGRTKNIMVQIYTVGSGFISGPWRAQSEDPGSMYIAGQKIDGKWTFPFAGLSCEVVDACEKYKTLANKFKDKGIKPGFDGEPRNEHLLFCRDEKVVAKVPRTYLQKVNRGISWVDGYLASLKESYD